MEKGYNIILKDNFESGLIRGQDQIYKGYVGHLDILLQIARKKCVRAQKVHRVSSDFPKCTRHAYTIALTAKIASSKTQTVSPFSCLHFSGEQSYSSLYVCYVFDDEKIYICPHLINANCLVVILQS